MNLETALQLLDFGSTLFLAVYIIYLGNVVIRRMLELIQSMVDDESN